MLSTTRNLTVRDLLQFHEPAVADWVETCTEEDFVRVCDVADFLSLHGPSSPSGGSMMLLKCVALAAVYVHDGAPRELARAKRDLKAVVPPITADSPSTNWSIQQQRPQYFAVGDDAIDYWAEHPDRARARRESFAAERVGGAP
ncbi:hypothetical protein KK092_07320 [Curtobacterium flaccumfaciens pv. flaccumfaciens]|uniref:hypothetical protein n=1 Tax=Curtobacterium flaccumfaciens TaxID=2035 RepID=UPI001BDDE416|nr:hypothetical protein [Curtobacterium flaccumfaciens]MBT1669187.1 hypothetical protein [Curtobacterium flaccumfaciens pv. flaccumfaciens]